MTTTPAEKLRAALQTQQAQAPKLALDWIVANHAPPEDGLPFDRTQRVRNPPPPKIPQGDLLDARARIRAEIAAYLADPNPGYGLLVVATPGVGKTTIAVALAEQARAEGLRVCMYLPRHQMFDDIAARSIAPEHLFEWQPRRAHEDKELETCRHAHNIEIWQRKGYDSMSFCAGVCGFEYIKSECQYHAQKRAAAGKIVCLQHQHAALGSLLDFDVAIGDELPLGAFLHRWDIPAKRVKPHGIVGMLELLTMRLANMAADGAYRVGRELMEELDASFVIKAADQWKDAQLAAPFGQIREAKEAKDADYFYLPTLLPILRAEAREYLAGRDYVARVIAGHGQLSILTRRDYDKSAPRKVIWLDGTGDEKIYQAIFEMPFKVVKARPRITGTIRQVIDSTNSKSTMLKPVPAEPANERELEQAQNDDEIVKVIAPLQPTERAHHCAALIRAIVRRYGYKSHAVVTFKGLAGIFNDAGFANFYGARGSNEHENVEAVFVLGSPMPEPYALAQIAAMLYPNRMKPFSTALTTKPVLYAWRDSDGSGITRDVTGFWDDDDMQTLLCLYREAEIEQAAHRNRPIRGGDVWLMTNIPIDNLPPTELMQSWQAAGVSKNVDLHRFLLAAEFIQSCDESLRYEHLAEILSVSHNTAVKYAAELVAMGIAEFCTVKGTRKPFKAIKSSKNSRINTNAP